MTTIASTPAQTTGRPAVPDLLLDRLREHAQATPDALACAFVAEDSPEGTEEEQLTYATLDREVGAVAAGLRAAGLKTGDRALLLLPEGADFVRGFLGCMRAGVIPVPAYPPLPVQSRQRVETLRSIVADCRPRAVVHSASDADVEAIQGVAPELADVVWRRPSEMLGETPDPAADHPAGADDVAFLQYTSGSTSAPKGVVVTHGALAHNLAMIGASFGLEEVPRFVSWLPLFHDMGLIGNLLHPLWAGGSSVLMTPMTFLKRPARWLRAIARYRAHVAGGPNFCFDLCVGRVRDSDIEGLDFSHWKIAFNGAEPVRPATLDAFTRRFSAYGFNPAAWWPCYGLAEATLLVTAVDARQVPNRLTLDKDAFQQDLIIPVEGAADGAADTTTLISCGAPLLDRTVLIADPETGVPTPPGRVGEIWVGGPLLPIGYWGNERATEETFRAIPAEGPQVPHMRTGDLGFLHDGELYVTGRCKDLIIVGGRNHYPQDIESTVEESHDAIRKGCVAAFAVDDGGEERVVVVVGAGQGAVGPGEEAGAKRAAIVRAAGVAVAADHGVALHDVVVVGPNAVPKTSSGKLRRAACRTSYLAGEYAPDARNGQKAQTAHTEES
ncbi:fatty acyl-AMP ligase [Streptomyces sp. DSM 44917]|uniref:Fatty acyl-AMP ligase n=1 Tax=Streptomyces boetiae TaxID=3075541 RepID=A0ABU2LBL9_9ACTN|nr:fatty acyl-AMP ligase [Streptomyces sp. DSM 44917]MDT0308876.1 fatty acyl-AMP ligase [Streptomyces sp. DSM 44917]